MSPPQQMNPSPRVRGGFTLIEVVLAISLLAGIMLTIYQVVGQLARAKQLADMKRDITVIADSLLGRLVRELQLAYAAGSPLMGEPDTTNPDDGRNVYMSLIPGQSNNGARSDQILFLALDAAQFFPEGGTQSGVVQIRYVLRPDPEAPRDNDSLVLVREETPVIQPPEEAYRRMVVFPLASQVVSLAFTALDGDESQWVSTWGEKPRTSRLPSLIQINLVLRRGDGALESFQTAVAIRTTTQ
jgi:prepilin-type N-terminal cleavage/methylation domain-containing protein